MEKIFSFIIDKSSQKLLLLLGNPKDPQFQRSFWYVVTGGKENQDLTLEDTVKREIQEETGLITNEIFYLNWIFKYKSLDEHCTEYVYISFVENDKIILNEENIDYRWCDLNTFINMIEWTGDKKILEKVLKKAIMKKLYYKSTIIYNCY